MLSTLTGPHVVTRTSRVDLRGPLMGPEQELVAGAVPCRVREFVTGRVLARDALAGLGVEACPIPAIDRAPVWPVDVVGSLTHCHGYRAAAVAYSHDVMTLGIDAEPAAPLPCDVAPMVLSPKERRLLGDQSIVGFSAKETLFKAWWPLQRHLLNFEDAEIMVEAPGRLKVRVDRRLNPPAPFHKPLKVRWALDGCVVLTALVVPGKIGDTWPVSTPG